MTTKSVCLRLTPESLLQCLETEARALLQTAESELALDLSAIPRIDVRAANALEELAGLASQKTIRIMLRNVNIDVYKSMTLLGLVRRFTFMS